MKIFFYLLSLFLISCSSTSITKTNQTFSLEYRNFPSFLNSLEAYTFNILIDFDCESPSCSSPHISIGKAFIADNQIWTAKHLKKSKIDFNSDYIVIGESSIKGLSICNENHVEGDKIFYMTNTRGILKGPLKKTNFWEIDFENREVHLGDSGSPVVCDHNKVVGILVGYFSSKRSVGILSSLNKSLVDQLP